MKLIPRQFQVIFEDEERKVTASLNLFINGETATIYSLIGKNIIYDLVNHLEVISIDLKVNVFYAIVEPAMLAFLERLFKNKHKHISIDKIREITLTNKLMLEVMITASQ